MSGAEGDDVEELLRQREDEGDDMKRYREVRGALDNLVKELRAASQPRNTYGLKVNVAIRVAEGVLKRYPEPPA